MANAKSRSVVTIIKTLVGIGLLAALLLWNGNGSKLLGVFAHFKPQFLFVLVVIALALNLVSSLKWSLFLRDCGTQLSQWKLLKLYLIGKFFNNFLPSMVGGDVARAYMLGRHISSHAVSAASVIMERATGMIALAFLAGIFVVINFPILSNPIISIAIAGGILGCTVAVVLYYWPPFRRFVIHVVSLLPIVNKMTGKLNKLLDALEQYRHHYRLLSLSLVYSVSFHFLASINVYATCLAIGFTPDFVDVLVITPVILMLTMIPVSPNNLGWWEWCFSVLLADAGATAAEGLAVALSIRVITLCVSLLGGLLFLMDKQTHPA